MGCLQIVFRKLWVTSQLASNKVAKRSRWNVSHHVWQQTPQKRNCAAVKPLMAQRCEPHRELGSCLRERNKAPTSASIDTHMAWYMAVTPRLSSRWGNPTLSKNTPASLKLFCFLSGRSLVAAHVFSAPWPQFFSLNSRELSDFCSAVGFCLQQPCQPE